MLKHKLRTTSPERETFHVAGLFATADLRLCDWIVVGPALPAEMRRRFGLPT